MDRNKTVFGRRQKVNCPKNSADGNIELFHFEELSFGKKRVSCVDVKNDSVIVSRAPKRTFKDSGTGKKIGEKNTVKTRAENSENGSEIYNVKRDFAPGAVLILGCVALALFFAFASFGKNVEGDIYESYANAENNGAISVFSQIIYPDGRIEKNESASYSTGNYPHTAEYEKTNYANDENGFKEESEGWNFWQYLCDSIAKIFGVTNVE